jgi:hypothetical protein
MHHDQECSDLFTVKSAQQLEENLATQGKNPNR